MPDSPSSSGNSFDALSDAEIDDLAALDALFHRSAHYRDTEEYKSFLDFVGKVPYYSPYNAALLHIQNPGVTHTATRRQWRDQFNRDVEPNARPYVILQPFGPVMLVYDVDQTVSRSGEESELPDRITDPFEVEGSLDERTWRRTLQSCKLEKVAVREDPKLHANYGGRIEVGKPLARRYGEPGATYLVTVNAEKALETRYIALAHELAHLFLGHLGADEGAWWESRPDTDHPQKELEAQSVAYLVARRAGLHSASERYLHWYVEAEGADEPLPQVRMRQVLDVVRYIEEMAEAEFVTDRDEVEGDVE